MPAIAESLGRPVSRFVPPPATAPPVVRVDALSRTVWRGDERIVLSKRAMSLVLALAIRKRLGRGALTELIWGEPAAAAGTQALKMLVSRARAQLGDPSLIVAAAGGYELRDDVVVDIVEIERLLRSLSPREPLTDSQRRALREAYDRFKHVTRGGAEDLAPSLEATIGWTRQRVVERLANDALERGEVGLAFELADELRRYDSRDEAAYELVIRAHIVTGNRAAAYREYRNYRAALMADLGIEPSFSIRDLIGEAPAKR